MSLHFENSKKNQPICADLIQDIRASQHEYSNRIHHLENRHYQSDSGRENESTHPLSRRTVSKGERKIVFLIKEQGKKCT